MHELHLPWLELAILLPAIGAIRVKLARDPDNARRQSLIFSGLTLACAIGAWWDFGSLHSPEARDRWGLSARLFRGNVLVIDQLSAPLLPVAALISFLTNMATLRTKVREFAFVRALASEAILMATLACKVPWGVVALLVAGTVSPYLGLRKVNKPRRVYVLHMLLFSGLLILGEALVDRRVSSPHGSTVGVVLLAAALLVRCGVVPVHVWVTDLFEHATFGTALLHVAPMVGAYAMARLVLPIAPESVLRFISAVALFTAVYAAGMALVQREARRFFCYVFLSHSSLILVGLATATPLSLTGALSLWLSLALSLTGFGLTIRCVEFRIGRISLTDSHGLYEHVPMLAALFLLTGLAGIGFPGTAGFISLELLVEGAVRPLPLVELFVVIVAALNGIVVTYAYFRIFTGKPHVASIDLRVRPAERTSVLVLTAVILGWGLNPQPGVAGRYRAAMTLYDARAGHPADNTGSSSRRPHPRRVAGGLVIEPPAPTTTLRALEDETASHPGDPAPAQ